PGWKSSSGNRAYRSSCAFALSYYRLILRRHCLFHAPEGPRAERVSVRRPNVPEAWNVLCAPVIPVTRILTMPFARAECSRPLSVRQITVSFGLLREFHGNKPLKINRNKNARIKDPGTLLQGRHRGLSWTAGE